MVGFTKYHYDRKPTLTFYERGPGPAAYKMAPLVGRRGHAVSHRINPEYSFGLKLPSSIIQKGISPGAAAYLIPQHLKTNGYFAGFKYTLRQKFPALDKKFVPAPNLYNVPPADNYRNRAPRHILGSRTPLIYKRIGPGPNAYLLPPAIGPRIPDKLAASECTLKGTRKSKELTPSPGPIYSIGSPELVKPKGPAFTIRRKWPELQSGWDAGPASYTPLFPPPCSCKTPVAGASLGIRYNDFTGIFRTSCDTSKYEPLD